MKKERHHKLSTHVSNLKDQVIILVQKLLVKYFTKIIHNYDNNQTKALLC